MTGPQELPPLGALVDDRGTTFHVWAPRPRTVELVLTGEDGQERIIPTSAKGEYRVARVEGAGHGQRYAYRLDGEGTFPDPCSRSQPDGVHAASEVVDPRRHEWHNPRFAAPPMADVVIYEMHIGTFTPEGSFDSAAAQLGDLAELGITAVELMPVAAFAGDRNWGYDGVALFAPAACYGGPDGLRRFVDAAHSHGLAVILDVVYNHFGPDGNYTGLYSDQYLTSRHQTPWGGAINFDGDGSKNVRHFVVENMRHWLREYHVDGFRLDAVHEIRDDSPEHVLAEIRRRTSGLAPGGRDPYLIVESDENDARYITRRESGGRGMDAVWADDFHHMVHTWLTEERDGYYAAYSGDGEDLGRTIAQGFFYEGQTDPVRGGPHGTPARGNPLSAFVYCLQNHDQVGNRAFGDRLHAQVARPNYLAASLMFLLLPQTPLLFQGQEYHASSPFLYFTDHNPELGDLVTRGRREEFARFDSFADPHLRLRIPDPQALETFERSVLNAAEGRTGLGALCRDLYREALRIRREDPVLREVRATGTLLVAEGEGHFLTVGMSGAAGMRIILVNMGHGVGLTTLPEGDWSAVLSSASPRWGSSAPEPQVLGDQARVPGNCAVFVARN